MPSKAKSNGKCKDCGTRNIMSRWDNRWGTTCYVCHSGNVEAVICPGCSQGIGIGQMIEWDRSRPSRWTMHWECYQKSEIFRPRYERPKKQQAETADDILAELDNVEVQVDVDASEAVDKDKADRFQDLPEEAPKPKPKVEKCKSFYDSVYLLIQARVHYYVYGPAGCGKSHIVQQAASDQAMEFRSTSLNVHTMPSALLGYLDAQGIYRSTDFRHIYEHGGVFLIDEMDNASGNLLTALNSALANGFLAFPDGMITMHRDCVVVATGNTTGRGKTAQYISRQTLDAATLDRFVYLSHDYDEELEIQLAAMVTPNGQFRGHVQYEECQDASVRMDWASIVQKMRANRVRHGLQVVVSMRPITLGCKLLNHYSTKQLAEMLIFKGTDGDTKAKLLEGITL